MTYLWCTYTVTCGAVLCLSVVITAPRWKPNSQSSSFKIPCQMWKRNKAWSAEWAADWECVVQEVSSWETFIFPQAQKWWVVDYCSTLVSCPENQNIAWRGATFALLFHHRLWGCWNVTVFTRGWQLGIAARKRAVVRSSSWVCKWMIYGQMSRMRGGATNRLANRGSGAAARHQIVS